MVPSTGLRIGPSGPQPSSNKNVNSKNGIKILLGSISDLSISPGCKALQYQKGGGILDETGAAITERKHGTSCMCTRIRHIVDAISSTVIDAKANHFMINHEATRVGVLWIIRVITPNPGFDTTPSSAKRRNSIFALEVSPKRSVLEVPSVMSLIFNLL